VCDHWGWSWPSDLGVRGALVATIMQFEDHLIVAISISLNHDGYRAHRRCGLGCAGLVLNTTLGMGTAYVAIVSLYVLSNPAERSAIVAPWKRTRSMNVVRCRAAALAAAQT